MINRLIFSFLAFIITGCSEKNSDKNSRDLDESSSQLLFSEIAPETSGITFQNKVTQTYEFNFLNYMYIYMGGGVAVGDIDNDGLDDLYFVSNFGPNKLYKNKGNFEFTDITNASGAADFSGFSTGVSMIDINSDGWLDIYVCKAGALKDPNARKNLLFINQKDGTFSEEGAQWKLDDSGFSTQAYPIDYDRDGDLDLYVVNHRNDFKNVTVVSGKIQRAIEESTSDQLYRNDGSSFTKVTGAAKLYNKAWGLSAVVSDFNEDGWDDIYVANDFLEPDALYINQQDGTFNNEILDRMSHIPFYSMGADYADINNDLLPDLINLDMTSSDHVRSKENMATMDTEAFNNLVKVGYHHAYMANMLQVNTGLGKFTETAQLSGISKTDWSWAPLFADFDNDGLKDLFITNGVEREYNNQDAKARLKEKQQIGGSMELEDVLNTFPTEKIPNHIYKNTGALNFENKIKDWGLTKATLSNGASYADLDNDGDLDLIVNNINDPAGIYRNNSRMNFIKVSLQGMDANPFGIGSQVIVTTTQGAQLQEVYTTRGYESSVPPQAHFGLKNQTEITSVKVHWPNGSISEVKNPTINTQLSIDFKNARNNHISKKENTNDKINIAPASIGIDYKHIENNFNDYNLQLLLPHKQSTKGTGIASTDVNGDGLDDFFVGNAEGASGALFIQNADGSFKKSNIGLWQQEAKYEDADALFFDADNDKDMDLYVVSAGYNLSENNSLLQDRLYLNDGKGNFARSANSLPDLLISGKSVAHGDYDKDGDIDLFIGGNVIPGGYPKTPKSYLLRNDNGIFNIVNNSMFSEIGMVSQAIFTDYDGDNDLDLLTVGEWAQPSFYDNNDGTFAKAETIEGMEHTEGWWSAVTAADFDNDGDQDYVLGNIGGNNKFHPTADKPLYISAKDFDTNGSYDVALSKTSNGKQLPIRGKQCSSEQNPFLLEKIETYKEFASLEIKDIYGEEVFKDALTFQASLFKSVYLNNLGNGNFEVVTLPNEAQTGPSLSFVVDDVDMDGNLDIVGVGAIYDSEVETIRYDSNYGYVLLGDGNGDFKASYSHQPFISKDSKDVICIAIDGKQHYIVVSNNSELDIFTFSP